ncbi:BolA family protein [Alteromonadaceae bacterium BrNp21-10]|nr:BolA family protein [Alteromonadaceae bacterium BrNp21-10]
MQISEIEDLLHSALSLSELKITGEGASFQIVAVGDIFDGVSRLKKQQIIYAPLKQQIADGSIHAITIKAFTPEQWKREKHFL